MRTMQSEIRNTLNRLLHDKGLPPLRRVYYVSREESEAKVKAADIETVTLVTRDYFRLNLGDDAVYIPYHRIVEITAGSEVLWKSRKWDLARERNNS
jgi:uncharacterized protein (UPF0248 family)